MGSPFVSGTRRSFADNVYGAWSGLLPLDRRFTPHKTFSRREPSETFDRESAETVRECAQEETGPRVVEQGEDFVARSAVRGLETTGEAGVGAP